MSDIENPWLFKNLVEQMRVNNIQQHVIDRFAEKWSRITSNTPYPCPNCFAHDDEGTLQAMSERNGVEPVHCRNCRTVYEIPIPK